MKNKKCPPFPFFQFPSLRRRRKLPIRPTAAVLPPEETNTYSVIYTQQNPSPYAVRTPQHARRQPQAANRNNAQKDFNLTPNRSITSIVTIMSVSIITIIIARTPQTSTNGMQRRNGPFLFHLANDECV